MKRWLLVLVQFLILLTDRQHSERYTVTFWGPFDSVVTITANAYSQQQFNCLTDAAITRFSELSNYYDRFNVPDRIVNIAVINRLAGKSAVPVSKEVFDLLAFAKKGAQRTENLVLPTFGSVTELWRRQIKGAINGENIPPSNSLLKKAVRYTSAELLQLDDNKKTASLTSSDTVIDVGAIAKGYATEIVGRELTAAGLSRLAISSGGNIRVFSPPAGKAFWPVGVQNPDSAVMGGDKAIATLSACNIAVATSGDYQRFFWYAGKRYHHLIEPATLYPAQYYRSVTVACANAGEADLFSTALFLAPWEKSVALAEKEKLAVLWICSDGTVKTNARMQRLLQG